MMKIFICIFIAIEICSVHAHNFQNNERSIENSRYRRNPDLQSNGTFSECSIKSNKVLFNNKCVEIFSTGQCPKGSWLVLTEDGNPRCKRNPCPKGRVYYKNACVFLKDRRMCGDNEKLQLQLTGIAACVCKPFSTYDPRKRFCVIDKELEPCPVEKVKIKGICKPNPCSDVELFDEETGNCYKKNFVDDCREKNQNLFFHDHGPKSSIVDCVEEEIFRKKTFQPLHNIFIAPEIRSCPPGKIRNHLGKCSTMFSFGSENTLNFGNFRQRSTCPTTGYTVYPDGVCRRRNFPMG